MWLVSISGHKMHGPARLALYVRRGRPNRRQSCVDCMSGHAPGTLATHQIVVGKAELAKQDLNQKSIARALRDRLWAGLQERLDELYLNGSWEHRLPNNLNVSFAYVKAKPYDGNQTDCLLEWFRVYQCEFGTHMYFVLWEWTSSWRTHPFVSESADSPQMKSICPRPHC